MRQINDPREITQDDLPFHFVLSNQATSLVAWAINWKTKANYDHCMDVINPGKFITQDFGGYHEVPMDQYLLKGGMLKFVKLTNANPSFNAAFKTAIQQRLAQPWWKKIYDYGNILGRAVGLNWLHLPGTYDCSEICLSVVRQCVAFLPVADSNLIMSINPQASPADLDDIIEANPSIFTIYGQWQADESTVI